jgi:RNA-directed DNA polymerase
VSLQTPDSVRRLQRALYVKAKSEPAYRFYLLYDKVYREDILTHAYRVSRAARGAPGVDGVTFADIESTGLEEWLAGLRRALQDKTYRPDPVRRVLIPKPDGGERPLGIPTIRDRVVQTAVKLVLEPIFEAAFDDGAYGYRPKRSARDAVRVVHDALCDGYTEVVDADLSKYFDTIPHQELLQSVARRVVDRQVLHLLKMWLKTPIEERDERGGRRMMGGKRSTRGTPQGGVVTPRTQKVTSVGSDVIGAAQPGRTAPARRSGRHRDGVADHDRVIADEHLLHDQAHDALALEDIQCVGGQA